MIHRAVIGRGPVKAGPPWDDARGSRRPREALRLISRARLRPRWEPWTLGRTSMETWISGQPSLRGRRDDLQACERPRYRHSQLMAFKRPAVAPAEGLLTEVVLKHTRVVPNSPPMTPGRHGGCSRTTAQAVPIVSAIATRPVPCQRSRRVKRSQRETAPRWRECRGQSPRPRASARGRDIRHSAQNWAAPVPRRPRGSLAVQTIAR